jgi:putative transposase
MGRLARVVAVDVPHHLTQRGNDRRFILDCDGDRATYLSSLRENTELYGVSVVGYCLMSNHVHLIVVPSTADGLAQALKQTHGRYATYWNTIHRASGHVWQGRYYSCPLDEPHLWEALRYTELNPLRAGMVCSHKVRVPSVHETLSTKLTKLRLSTKLPSVHETLRDIRNNPRNSRRLEGKGDGR